MKRLKKSAAALVVLYIISSLALLPSKATEAASYAVNLCLNVAIPSLFPFFVASSVFVLMGYAGYLSRFFSPFMQRAFNTSGAGAAAVVMGFVSGYPVGAATVSSLYKNGEISKTEAERLLAFTNNSGPIFVIGALGTGILASKNIGFMLYISHILSALAVGFVFKHYKKNSELASFCLPSGRGEEKKSLCSALAEGINSSVQTMLKVCGFIILFSVVCAFIPSGGARGFVYSLFEITGGLNLLAQSKLDKEVLLCFVSFFLGFSGLSVFCQVKGITSEVGLGIKTYFFGKLLQGIFSVFITKILLKYFVTYTPVFSSFDNYFETVLPKSLWQASLSVVLFALLMIFGLLVLGYIFEKRK